MNAATLALATWSIVAVDPRTHEVGAALASCIWVEGFRIGQVVELLPGTGAVVAQALANEEARTVIADAGNAQEARAAGMLEGHDVAGLDSHGRRRQPEAGPLARGPSLVEPGVGGARGLGAIHDERQLCIGDPARGTGQASRLHRPVVKGAPSRRRGRM